MIYVDPEDLEILKQIFSGPYQAIVFGSRVTGKHRKFSDIDICIKSNPPLSAYEMELLQEQCEESDLPFKVDLMRYEDINPYFQEIVDTKGVLLNKKL
jgi:predicted nucleotidyltransferase